MFTFTYLQQIQDIMKFPFLYPKGALCPEH